MQTEAAMDMARDALIWMTGEPEMLGAFLALTGTDPGDLRGRVNDPDFLGAVLDHLLGSEAAVRSFAQTQGIAPDRPAAARAALPGGPTPHWT